MVKSKIAKSEEGFSMLEVLVMTLTLTGFLLGVLQGIMMAALLRVQAEDKTEVLNWIEQDLELIRDQAFILDQSGGSYNPDTTTCSNSTYGERLRQEVIGSSDYPPTTNPPDSGTTFLATATVNIGGNSYDIYRDYAPLDNHLQITYTVVYDSTHIRYKSNDPYSPPNSNNTNIVSTLLTDVIPNAALDCP